MTPDQATIYAAILAALIAAFVSLGTTLLTLIVSTILALSSYSNAKKIESIRGDVQKIVSEHDTRFSYLHERRGEVIAELYKQIADLSRVFSTAFTLKMSGEPTEEDQLAEGFNTASNFYIYVQRNRIYLDSDLNEKIRKFIVQLVEASVNYKMMQLYSSENWAAYGFSPELRTRHYEALRRTINENLPPIRDDIEKKMQAVLGV